jgi:Raf kinase inhibitor-like YbhB/YbcL family protein
MELTSNAFDEGDQIPVEYTCDGDDISPPLSWSDVPEDARSFVIVLEDVDASGGPFRHWGIFNIPADDRVLPSDIPPRSEEMELRQAKNGFGTVGYEGPCPPRSDSEHSYRFRIYALSISELEFPEPPKVVELKESLRPHLIGHTELNCLYERQGD